MSVVLDTNVVSAILHRDPRALAHLAQHEPGDVFLTSPVAAEIHFGLERLPEGSRRRVLLTREYRRLRDAVEWSDWSEAAAETFGRLKAALQRQGQPIEDMDVAIASIAVSLGAAVATRNTRHLGRVGAVVVEDWSAD